MSNFTRVKWFVLGLSVPFLLSGSLWVMCGVGVVLMVVFGCYALPLAAVLVTDIVFGGGGSLHTYYGLAPTISMLCLAALAYTLRRVLTL